MTTIHSHMAYQTCCIARYFVTAKIRVTNWLLLKDLYKMSLQQFAIMLLHMTSKSAYGQRNPALDATSICKLKSLRDRGQVQHQKCSFQDGIFDSWHFKYFTTIVDHVYLVDRFSGIFSQIYTKCLEVVFNDIIKINFWSVSSA